LRAIEHFKAAFPNQADRRAAFDDPKQQRQIVQWLESQTRDAINKRQVILHRNDPRLPPQTKAWPLNP
jgi:hypothetical protein